MKYIFATAVWILFFYVLYQTGEAFEQAVRYYKP